MEWTCTQCGSSAIVAKSRLLRSMGWKVLGRGECICAPCLKRVRRDHPALVAVEIRRRPARSPNEPRDAGPTARDGRKRCRGEE